MDETIAGWSPADLRRFVVNTILTDPGAYPKQAKDNSPKVTVSATPPSANNGDIWIYQGNGFDWQFVFDASDATYPWRFIGGPATVSATTTAQGTAGVPTWLTVPTLTVPRSGHYLVGADAEMYQTIHSTDQIYWEFDVGDGTNVFNYARYEFTADGALYGTNNYVHAIHATIAPREQVLTAGTVLKLRLAPNAGWDVTSDERSINLIPIRIS